LQRKVEKSCRKEEVLEQWPVPAWHGQEGREHCLNTNCNSTGLRSPGCWEAFTQEVPANAFTRLLCPFPNSNCICRDDKMESKYICSSWEKPISFALV